MKRKVARRVNALPSLKGRPESGACEVQGAGWGTHSGPAKFSPPRPMYTACALPPSKRRHDGCFLEKLLVQVDGGQSLDVDSHGTEGRVRAVRET